MAAYIYMTFAVEHHTLCYISNIQCHRVNTNELESCGGDRTLLLKPCWHQFYSMFNWSVLYQIQRGIWWLSWCHFSCPQKKNCNFVFTPWCSTQTSRRHSLLLKCHTLSQDTWKCNFIYACNKSTAFPVPILMEEHYVQIS